MATEIETAGVERAPPDTITSISTRDYTTRADADGPRASAPTGITAAPSARTGSDRCRRSRRPSPVRPGPRPSPGFRCDGRLLPEARPCGPKGLPRAAPATAGTARREGATPAPNTLLLPQLAAAPVARLPPAAFRRGLQDVGPGQGGQASACAGVQHTKDKGAGRIAPGPPSCVPLAGDHAPEPGRGASGALRPAPRVRSPSRPCRRARRPHQPPACLPAVRQLQPRW